MWCERWNIKNNEDKNQAIYFSYFPRCTPVCDLHTDFNLPYIYDYITELCRKQAEAIRNHENDNVCSIGQGEPRHRKYKRLKLGGGQAYDRSSD
jgi:hypothetical protein